MRCLMNAFKTALRDDEFSFKIFKNLYETKVIAFMWKTNSLITHFHVYIMMKTQCKEHMYFAKLLLIKYLMLSIHFGVHVRFPKGRELIKRIQQKSCGM